MLYVMTRLGGIIFVDADAPRPLRPSFDTSISFSLIFTPCFLGGGGFDLDKPATLLHSRMLSLACEIASSAPCVTACAA